MLTHYASQLISRTWKGIPDRWRATAWHAFLSSEAQERKDSLSDEQIVTRFYVRHGPLFSLLPILAKFFGRGLIGANGEGDINRHSWSRVLPMMCRLTWTFRERSTGTCCSGEDIAEGE